VVLSSGENPPESKGRAVVAILVVAALALVGAGYWYLTREAPTAAPPPERPAPGGVTTPTPPPEPPPSAAAGTGVLDISGTVDGATVAVDGRELGLLPRSVDLGAGPHTIRVEKEGYRTFEREVHIVPGRTLEIEARLDVVPPRLSVDADVPGAQVFLDRRFVGKTPLVIPDVEPGEHRLNVSAEGYEGFRKDVTVGPGRNEVHVRFKEVRLDESLAVKHKHGLGSCRGRLVASPAGLRYDTDHDKDGFQLPFSSLEPLEVDYVGKNLRVKVRGGRTYNFTAEDADQLLTFQRAVEAARKRLP
jgi:hypothetical protein